MSITYKNCLAANLFQLLGYQNISANKLFWPLIDISDQEHEQVGINWVPYYLAHFGMEENKLWKLYTAESFNQFKNHIRHNHQKKILLLAPIKAIRYRNDISNHLYSNTNMRHALLVHNHESPLLEDVTVGTAGDRFPISRLTKEQFEFPMDFVELEQDYFLDYIQRAGIEESIWDFKHKLERRSEKIINLKADLLIALFESEQADLLSLSERNLYEQALQYRQNFCTYWHNTQLDEIQEKYEHILNKVKTIYLRKQLSISELNDRSIYSQVYSLVTQLKKLDQQFYEVYSTLQQA